MTGSAATTRIAVIDRDDRFLRMVERRATAHGWEQLVLSRAASVEELAAMRLGALVIDLGLLGETGWEYLPQVHTALPSLPVVICSGPSSVAQRVRALWLGADDWLTKPCHPEELIARIEARLRRSRLAAGSVDAESVIEAGELSIRPRELQAFVGEQSVNLTRREFELLCLLAANPGRVLRREAIYQRVWGHAMSRGDRSVDVFVRKLRQKLDEVSSRWRYIHTHFGIGYRFAPEPIEDSAAASHESASES